ncbi:MAG: flagellar brake domain-containing protein [Phycisphaerae bacterium]|nr:flagellar brake domain-containing protein [Phycisphaerae bacterium]
MPASRSRTVEWRRSLEELSEKGGSLEIAVARPEGSEDPRLLWRLRILSVTDEGLVVEAPGALGRTVQLHLGTAIEAFIVIGQNRWQFDTVVTKEIPAGVLPDARFGAVGLSMPESVRRCMRQFARVNVSMLDLPMVDMWPLLDPKSVVAAERANELRFAALPTGALARPAGAATVATVAATDDEALLPTVGPRFFAQLANIGGGGAGLVVEPSEAAALSRHRVFWVRLPLGEICPVPIVCTAKVVHTHIDSSQRTYAGLSFDFTFNTAHQKTVVAQVERSVRALELKQRLTDDRDDADRDTDAA